MLGSSHFLAYQGLIPRCPLHLVPHLLPPDVPSIPLLAFPIPRCLPTCPRNSGSRCIHPEFPQHPHFLSSWLPFPFPLLLGHPKTPVAKAKAQRRLFIPRLWEATFLPLSGPIPLRPSGMMMTQQGLGRIFPLPCPAANVFDLWMNSPKSAFGAAPAALTSATGWNINSPFFFFFWERRNERGARKAES